MDALTFFRYAEKDAPRYHEQLANLLAPILQPQEGRVPNLGPQKVQDWLHYANLGAEDDPSLGTYFGINTAGEVIVTGTLLADYYDYRELLGLEGDRLWRCVLTHPAYRQLGYGLSLCQHMDNQIQALVNQTRISQRHDLYTGEYAAIRIYEQLRFINKHDLRIVPPGEPKSEHALLVKRLFEKEYSPPPEQ